MFVIFAEDMSNTVRFMQNSKINVEIIRWKTFESCSVGLYNIGINGNDLEPLRVKVLRIVMLACKRIEHVAFEM